MSNDCTNNEEPSENNHSMLLANEEETTAIKSELNASIITDAAEAVASAVVNTNDGNEDNIHQNDDILNTTASPSQDSSISHVQENGPSETPSNRKRKYDEKEAQHTNNHNGNSHSGSNKRNNSSRKSSSHNTSNSNSSSDQEDVYLKLLIPSSAAGGVIGRGGEKIAQIQKDANVRMKMSKANDYYPNTNERICLIIGSVRAVLKVILIFSNFSTLKRNLMCF